MICGAHLLISSAFVLCRWPGRNQALVCIRRSLATKRYSMVSVRPRLSPGCAPVSTALYWLQNSEYATDDFTTRIWSDLGSDQQHWVLVTLLLDDVYPPDSRTVREIAELVRNWNEQLDQIEIPFTQDERSRTITELREELESILAEL